jgi:hypothetical protein
VRSSRESICLNAIETRRPTRDVFGLTCGISSVTVAWMGFTKLFSRIILSSIWNEDDKTRLVWITILAIKDENHMVDCALSGLARAARVSDEECEKAIAILEAPDPDDSSGIEDGRRIKKVQGGWFVVNGATYQEVGLAEWKLEQIRWKTAERVRRYRAKKDSDVTVTIGNNLKQNVTPLLDIDIDRDKEEKSSCFVLENEPSRASEIGSASPKTPEKKPRRKSPMMNGDALQEFKRNPAYEGLDISREAWKFKTWCEKNEKPQTQKRFLGWLNRVR